MEQCSFAGCLKASRCRGWCSAHYERWRKHGDPTIVLAPVPPPLPIRTQPDLCVVAECDKAPWARSMCSPHYLKWRKHGDPLADHRRLRNGCRVEACTRLAHGHELCTMHYRRWRIYGDAAWEGPSYSACTIDGCVRPSRNKANPLCEAHYCKLWRNGTLDPGNCKDCQSPLPVSPFGRKYCKACALDRYRARGRNSMHRRRALLAGTESERIDYNEIFERDRWICGLCRKRVDKKLAWPHPMSKSLDHVIPIARHGAHVKANVQLAHLHCNLSKQDRCYGEQLMLFG